MLRVFYRITGIKLLIELFAKKKKCFRLLRAKNKSRKIIKKFRAQYSEFQIGATSCAEARTK